MGKRYLATWHPEDNCGGAIAYYPWERAYMLACGGMWLVDLWPEHERAAIRRKYRKGIIGDFATMEEANAAVKAHVDAFCAAKNANVELPPSTKLWSASSTKLYRHFDAKGTLLYVGMSLNPFKRLGEHRHAHWYESIDRVEIERFETRAEAAAAEREAIRREKPLHNIAYVDESVS
jgi:predicted GIY-YIG superfamily endonuclease